MKKGELRIGMVAFLHRSQFCHKTESVAIGSRWRKRNKGREETSENKVRDASKKLKRKEGKYENQMSSKG